MMTAALVALGAAFGAPARWLVDRAVARRIDSVFPWGTFVINTSGSFVLGCVLAATSDVPAVDAVAAAHWAALLGTGFCGAFTTFSTFAYETTRLVQDGSRGLATLNVFLSTLVGTAAAVAGWYVTTWLAG